MTNKDNKQDTNEIDTYKTYNRELIRGDGPHDNKTAEVETKSLKTTPPPPKKKGSVLPHRADWISVMKVT